MLNSQQEKLINIKDASGRTALHNAAFRGDIITMKDLLQKGANVNAKDYNNTTPLHSARTKEVAEILIENGADINITNKNGNTPFLSVLLYANGLNNNPAELVKCKELIEFLLNKGANIVSKDNYEVLSHYTQLMSKIGINTDVIKESLISLPSNISYKTIESVVAKVINPAYDFKNDASNNKDISIVELYKNIRKISQEKHLDANNVINMLFSPNPTLFQKTFEIDYHPDSDTIDKLMTLIGENPW